MNFLEAKTYKCYFWSRFRVLVPLWIPLAVYIGFWSIVFVIVGIEALIDCLNWRK